MIIVTDLKVFNFLSTFLDPEGFWLFGISYCFCESILFEFLEVLTASLGVFLIKEEDGV